MWHDYGTMDWRLFRTVLAALILYGLAKSGQLFTIGGVVMVIIMFSIIAYKKRPHRPPRIYPKGREPDADEWR